MKQIMEIRKGQPVLKISIEILKNVNLAVRPKIFPMLTMDAGDNEDGEIMVSQDSA